jgi:hypothetical protein
MRAFVLGALPAPLAPYGSKFGVEGSGVVVEGLGSRV